MIMSSVGRDAIAAHEPIAAYAQAAGANQFVARYRQCAGQGGFLVALDNAHASVSTLLDRYGVAVRAEPMAMPLLKRFGATSTCRASFALYNGKDDVDALVEGIEKARTFF